MLTPVDIQQKRFHLGIGYDKKDVNAFFEQVVESYEQLYRSNADLKEKVMTLNDSLQHYKSKEASLEKSLMLAEKDSEDTKSKATREAKNIELEAKNKAKNIIGDAEERLAEIEAKMAQLETQYAAYKSNFCSLMKQQFDFMQEKDFDLDAHIDDKALTLLGGSVASSASTSSASFGSFTGDPQMRDESTLGGAASSMSREDLTSTSAVYTSNLGANENFVDPFNPNKKENGRYNPYDGAAPKTSSGSSKGKTTFTVSGSGSKSRSRRPSPSKPMTEQANNTDSKESKVNFAPKDEEKAKTNPIPTVDFGTKPSPEPSKEEKEIVNDVEINIDESTLIADDADSNSETDEFGFEFV